MDEYRCPSCSTEVRPGETTCPGCGGPLEFDAPPSHEAGGPPGAPDPDADAHADEIIVSREVYDTYWPIAPLGYWLVVFFIGIAVLSIVSIGSNLAQDRLLAEIEQGVTVSQETAEANDSRQMVLALLELGVIVTTSTLFLIWFYRAYRNLPSFGVQELRHRQSWVVGGFFMPVLNLVRPYQVMKEVWWGSDPDLVPGSGKLPRQGAALPLLWWWSYLIMNMASTIAMQLMLRQDDSLAGLRMATKVDIGASAITIVATIFAAGIVREISVRQAEKRERIFIGSW
jgi:hypothetical protein